MRLSQRLSAHVGKGMVLVLGLVGLILLVGLISAGRTSLVGAEVHPKLEASILSFDGTDFVRTQTTLMTSDGKSAANTKLDHASPAYKALTEKHSFEGDVTVFGKKYHGDYAPLMSDDGKVTGALFVGVPK